MSMKVKCIAMKELFHNNNYYIIPFRPLLPHPKELSLNEYGLFVCCGEYPFIVTGKEYELIIEDFKMNYYRGKSTMQYNIVSCPSLEKQDFHNLSRDESFEILMDVTSSQNIANNILNEYPNFIEHVLLNGKEGIDTKNIYGVGEVYLNAYVRTILEKYKYYHIIKKLTTYEINITECKKLLDKFTDEQTIQEELKKHPYYILTEVLERSFNSVDKLLLEKRKDLIESYDRCESLIVWLLKENEKIGSTRLKGNKLFVYIRDIIKAKELLPKFKDVCINSERIYYDDKSKDLSIMSTYLGEVMVCDFVKEKLSIDNKLDIDIEKYRDIGKFSLVDKQMGGLQNFCDYMFSIIAGFSGAGKSQSVKGLVKLMEDNSLSYLLLSSTGKASKVLGDSCNRKAYTIHKKCYEGDIDVDVVVIDEFGMVSLDTFCMFINSLKNPNTRIVLCGDTAQLSAIGLSKIFDDLISSKKVPMVMLTEIFRYKSDGSLYVATNVRNGKNFFENSDMCKYNDKNDSYSICNNYKFLMRSDDEIVDSVVEEYRKLLNKKIKPIDIMVLSPMNKYSIGTYELNNVLQAEFNPPKPNELELVRRINVDGDKIEIKFRKNDLVINTKNDYHAVSYQAFLRMNESENVLSEEDVSDSSIVNGQIGVVVEIVKNGMIVNFDDDLIYISKNKLNNILLGRALSIHKSQGSSIDYTISVIGKYQSKMVTRGLLYVEMTRCRKAHVDIGDIETLENGLEIVDNDKKDTWLKELLLKE